MSSERFRVHRIFGLLSLIIQVPLMVSGCASAGAGYQKTSSHALKGSSATMIVENRHWSDVTVYIVFGDQTLRLGRVETSATRTFPIPALIPLPAALNLLAVPFVSGEKYLSTSINVITGDAIIFTVENVPQFSTLLKR